MTKTTEEYSGMTKEYNVAKKEEPKKEPKKEYPPIEGVVTFMEGTEILTREYRVKSAKKGD